jgi:hypothetical protein
MIHLFYINKIVEPVQVLLVRGVSLNIIKLDPLVVVQGKIMQLGWKRKGGKSGGHFSMVVWDL